MYSTSPPFNSKEINEGTLFNRTIGKQYELNQGLNIIEFEIDFDHVKIDGLEFVNCEALDEASLEIFIGETKLNQFGFDVNLCNDFYARTSKYDADLFKGIKLVITYKSKSEKTIGINYLLHEVKQ